MPEKYDATVLRRIMDDFAMILSKHLAEEIDTLLGLDDCDEGELKKMYKVFENEAVAGADKVRSPTMFWTMAKS